MRAKHSLATKKAETINQTKKDAFRHPFIHPYWDVSSYTSDATHNRRSAEGTAR